MGAPLAPGKRMTHCHARRHTRRVREAWRETWCEEILRGLVRGIADCGGKDCSGSQMSLRGRGERADRDRPSQGGSMVELTLFTVKSPQNVISLTEV